MTAETCAVVGHRGFKAKYTENTLSGFLKCFQTGAMSFETDLWMTKDHVLVISHDVNTNRIFCDGNGRKTSYNILETDYEVLKTPRTIESGEPLFRFTDLLQWFVAYVNENDAAGERKMMLDLKAANPPVLLKLIVQDMLSVHSELAWWFPRIQLGVWHLRFIKYLNQDPELQQLFLETQPYRGYTHFELIHISYSWKSSMIFAEYNEYLERAHANLFKFKTTGVSLIYTNTWSTKFVKNFMPTVKQQTWSLYTWTCNTKPQLTYFCKVCQFDDVKAYGVITDHPDTMVELCDDVIAPVSPPKASFSQRLTSYILGTVSRCPRVDDGSFDSYVEPLQMQSVKMTPGKKIFAYLQQIGIF